MKTELKSLCFDFTADNPIFKDIVIINKNTRIKIMINVIIANRPNPNKN
jgi:hypothetical protein